MKRIIFFIVLSCFISCSSKESDSLIIDNVNYFEWKGDENSKKALSKVFNFLGSRKKWADLKSLHVTYIQQDDNFGEYPSRQWQSLDSIKIVLDQRIKNKRIIRILNDTLGWAINDSGISEMNELNREFLRYWYQLDFFKKIHDLAIGKDLKVRFTDQYQIIVLKDGRYFCGFQVDQELEPEIFHRPKFNDQNISLRLLEWKEKDGYVYPFRGKAVEQDFSFKVTEIAFSEKSASEAFGVSFNSDYDTTAIYNH